MQLNFSLLTEEALWIHQILKSCRDNKKLKKLKIKIFLKFKGDDSFLSNLILDWI